MVNNLIKNKTIAIVLAVLTFILGSVLLVCLIFYLAGLPLSSIPENQTYAVFAILVSAVLASLVYGRGSKERASVVAEYLNEKLEIEVEGKDIRGLIDLLEKFPPFVINSYVSENINGVKEFEEQIKEQTSHLTEEDLSKIRKVMEMPVPELQNLLNDLYLRTKLEQFKTLGEPKAEPLIALNLKELKKILFNE
jgi:hypothetical protein